MDTVSTAADTLYRYISTGLGRGEGLAVLPEAEKLLALEGTTERACVALAVTLLQGGRLNEAEQVLNAFIADRGETAAALANLAKISAERGDEAAARTMARRSVQRETNQDNALWWWASLTRKTSTDAEYRAALEAVAALKGSWRVHLILAELELEGDDEAAAQARFNQAIASASSPALPMVLGARRWLELDRPERVIELLKAYSAEEHGLEPGLALLDAYARLKRTDDATALLAKLRVLPGAAHAPQIAQWEEQLVQQVRAEVDVAKSRASGLLIRAPIWSAPLSGAVAGLLPEPQQKKSIIIAAFRDLDANPSEPGWVTATESSDMARALPLALSEALRVAGFESYALLPLVEKLGFIPASYPLDLARVLELIPPRHVPDLLVTGTLSRGIAERNLELEVFDLRQRGAVRSVRAFTNRTNAELFASAWKQLQRHLSIPASTSALESDEYLHALAAAVPIFALGGGAIDARYVARPIGSFERCLDAAMNAPEHLQTQLLAVAVFLEARRLSLPDARRFDAAITELVTQNKSEAVRRLAPLVAERLSK